ncbi:MAG: SusC/RagA family TonB-linked outer membrane protein, partial [Paludibacter sp.]|nr:SusC/RagA family TonB-linked outer membrane protein [Paludibacter sp.]
MDQCQLINLINMKTNQKWLLLFSDSIVKPLKHIIRFTIVLFLYLLSSSLNTQAQNNVSGTVRDNKGEPLVGVSIISKNGNNITGTTTDFEGRYRINVNSRSALEFSYIGFKTTIIQVGAKKIIDISLEPDDKLLQEVVVVGYGTQKKVNLTGSIAQVTSESLQDRPTSSVTQMLQGAMPNVNIQVKTGSPGAGGTLTIRGVGSINSSSPLIMVDGVPGSLDQLNPNDIESISVLKDASSAAIYGARAAFGVVLISTKKAKSGKPKVSYDAYFASSNPTVSTDFVTSGYEHALIYDTSYKSLGSSATGYTEDDYKELEARRFDVTENPERPWVVTTIDNNGKEKYNYYGNFDLWNWMYNENMMSQSHNINISGGTDKVQYYISGSYYTKEGLTKRVDEDYNQYTLNAKIN